MINTSSPLAAGLQSLKISPDSCDGIFSFCDPYLDSSFITPCIWVVQVQITSLQLSSSLVCDSSSGSSHRGGSAVQAPRQTPQSPADVAHLALPDLGVEDVLEQQLQQLTLAQFTVATMEHVIPLLKTGRRGIGEKMFWNYINQWSPSIFCLSKDLIVQISPHLFHYIDCILSSFDPVKMSPPCSCSVPLSLPFLLSQRVRMCSIVFWSCCATPSSCLGTVFVSWSGMIAAWWGWSWQVKTQLMTASYVDEWIHFVKKGNWVGHQTICHRHTGIRYSIVKENCRHVIELNELYKVTKPSCWLQRASHTYIQTFRLYPWVYPSIELLG